MPASQPPLSALLPPLILGTATFNTQFTSTPDRLPVPSIILRALLSGINAFDTSPYYGPSETLLGKALSSPLIARAFPRSTYLLLTKVGRIASTSFDYSPAWIRHSVRRSLARLQTSWLDVVYAHDVEFVSPAEVLQAVRELRRLRDEEGVLRYVGISGYPLDVLVELADMVLRETGEPLDVVMSYARGGVQNCALWREGEGVEGSEKERMSPVERLRRAGVGCVPNASLLGMGLLRTQGVPVTEVGDWHPAPRGLREAMSRAARWCAGRGEKLEDVGLAWALEQWARRGRIAGGKGGVGISVLGVCTLQELEDNLRVWEGVRDGLDLAGVEVHEEKRNVSQARRREVDGLVSTVRKILGEWKDFAWASPNEHFVNTRIVQGAMPAAMTSHKLEVEDLRADADLQVTVKIGSELP